MFLELPTSLFWESTCNFEPGKLQRKEPHHSSTAVGRFTIKLNKCEVERKISIAMKTREIRMQASTRFVLSLEYECALQLHETNAMRF